MKIIFDLDRYLLTKNPRLLDELIVVCERLAEVMEKQKDEEKRALYLGYKGQLRSLYPYTGC